MTQAAIPSHVPPVTPPTDADKLFSTTIPEEFRDKPYLKDLGAMPIGEAATKELFKKLDGAQSLIGKKSGIPEADASVDEWEKFHSQFRPENSEAYEFVVKEGQSPDPEFAKTVKSAFYEAGLSKGQAARVLKPIFAAVEKQAELRETEQKRLTQEFEELSKATFGPDSEAVLAQTKEDLKELAPENLKAHADKLSKNELVFLMGIMRAVREKYINEDTPPNKDSRNSSASGIAELQEEGRKIMMSEEYKDEFHPKHAEAVAKISEIYAKVGKMKDQAAKK